MPSTSPLTPLVFCVADTFRSALRPLRVPLQSKKSKRCPTCRHILIKPEQKAQSTRFKIKLVASNYIPAMEVSKPQDSSLASRRRTGIPLPVSMGGSEYLQAGRTYQFMMAFTNPLYDPINLRLALQDPPKLTAGKRPPFVVALPTNTITVAAFTDTWEYEEDEAMEDAGVAEPKSAGAVGGREERGRWKVGVVERKANVTKIGGELTLGRDAEGEIKVCFPRVLSCRWTNRCGPVQPFSYVYLQVRRRTGRRRGERDREERRGRTAEDVRLLDCRMLGEDCAEGACPGGRLGYGLYFRIPV